MFVLLEMSGIAVFMMPSKFFIQSLVLAQSDFADIREIVEPPGYGFWLFGVLIAFVWIGFFVWRRFRSDRKTVLPEIPESASEKARRLLGSLEDGKKGLDSESFGVEESMILRSYLEEALELRALEQTAQEFLLALQEETWLTSELRKNLEEFVRVADLVKFARQTLRDDQREKLLASALEVVEATESQPEKIGRASCRERV